MSLFSKTPKRIGKEQFVPAEPLVPYIEVKRVGAIKYKLVLNPHKQYAYTNWRGKYYTDYSYGYWRWETSTSTWYAFGSKAHAEAYAKRIMNRYLRRVSYRTGGAVRITGKVI